MPRMTAPNTHAGMLKKKRANGYSATNTRNTHSSTGASPAWGRLISVPTMPGITTIRSSRNTANWLRPSRPSSCRAEVPQDHERDDEPDRLALREVVGQRPRDQPPHLAVEHLVGSAGSAPNTLVLSGPRAPRRTCWPRRAITTSTVVVTSSVPMLNHGSLGPRRSGTEMEKRPAIAPRYPRPADG